MGGNGNVQLLVGFSHPGRVFWLHSGDERAEEFVRRSDFSLKCLSTSWPVGQWDQEHWRGRGLSTNGTRAPRGVVSTSPGRTASYYPAVMLHQSFTTHFPWLIASFWYHIKQIITCSSNRVSTLRTLLCKPRLLIKVFRRNLFGSVSSL